MSEKETGSGEAKELNEAELEQASGGLLPAVNVGIVNPNTIAGAVGPESPLKITHKIVK